MMKLQLFGFQTEVDEHKTHDWYAHSSEWSCSCGYCRNFVQLTKIQKLPHYMMDTLRMLDIPFEKPPMSLNGLLIMKSFTIKSVIV